MAIEQNLEQVGLSRKEVKVYLALLELGTGNMVDLSKKSGIKRTTVYEVVDTLINKGLISQTIIGKRKKFTAEPPEKFFQTKRTELETLGSILPTLNALRNVAVEKPALKFYQGIDDIKRLFEDMILNTSPVDDKLLGIDTKPEVLVDRGSADAQYWSSLMAKKKKRGLHSLTIDTAKKEHLLQFAAEHPTGFDHGIEVRLLDDPDDKYNMSFYLYQNKVAIVAGDQLFAFVIENKRLKDSFEFIFHKLWDKSEKVPELNSIE
jgi:predicted DNA-binding transcriptional regulator